MGRLQPQARELEEAVLGALMLENDAYSMVSEILKPECFYEKAHEMIYSAIVDLAAAQRPIDMLTVTERVQHDEIKILLLQFTFGICCLVICFQGKANQYLSLLLDSAQ